LCVIRIVILSVAKNPRIFLVVPRSTPFTENALTAVACVHTAVAHHPL
jgi:hypothetical protein